MTGATTTPPDIAPGRSRTGWLLLGAMVAGAVFGVLAYRQHRDWPFWMVDFDVYRLGADTVLHGGALYDVTTGGGLPFTYSPIAALLFVPVLVVPAAVWAGLEILFLELAVWLTLGAVGVTRTGPRAAATVVLTFGALFGSPVDSDLSLGQINLLLMFVVLVDLLRGEGRRWQGVGVGVVAAFKLVPLIFVVYLACTGRVRSARTALGTFLLCVAVGFAVLPGDSVRYWFGAGFSPERVGTPESPFNQSLRGVVARLTRSATTINPVWVVVAVVVGVAGLGAAILLHRNGRRLRGILVCALTACLVSPVSWEHHWVWTIPVVILLGTLAVRERSVGWAVVAVAAAAAYGLRLLDWFVPEFGPALLDLDAGPQLAAACFALSGMALIVVLTVTGRRTDVAGAL
ncbi:glycosyltransferase 87 family protein [Actinophytocola sp.]|uniref:glycosyltransferase 87 family protein n=1 Tax=Actinophytocola sp. TaxID=1872138 RepID=UPI002ED89225